MTPRISFALTLAVLVSVACDQGPAAPPAASELLVEPALLRAVLESPRYGNQTDPSAASAAMISAAGEASCTTIGFEGVGDLAMVGSVAGTTFGDSWFGLVDQDAGGSGPFANEPSPSTVALQLDESDVDIVLAEPAAYVSLYYSALAEALPLVLEGIDGADAVVASAAGTVVGANSDPPPCDGDPEGWFCGWEFLEISVTDPTITTLRIQGPPDTETAWAIDDLVICSSEPEGDLPEDENTVDIDIRPGSDQNTVNPSSAGKLKVVLFGSEELDVSDVDPESITLGDGEELETPLARKGGDRPMVQSIDANADGRLDLMMHFNIASLVANGDLTEETTELVLLGSMLPSGTTTGTSGAEVVDAALRGSDDVRVVGEQGEDVGEAHASRQ